jgi:hypothetical protein
MTSDGDSSFFRYEYHKHDGGRVFMFYRPERVIKQTMDVPAMQLNIAEQIELIINPVMVTLPPPFANTEETIVINVDGEIGLAQLNPNAKLEVK